MSGDAVEYHDNLLSFNDGKDFFEAVLGGMLVDDSESVGSSESVESDATNNSSSSDLEDLSPFVDHDATDAAYTEGHEEHSETDDAMNDDELDTRHSDVDDVGENEARESDEESLSPFVDRDAEDDAGNSSFIETRESDEESSFLENDNNELSTKSVSGGDEKEEKIIAARTSKYTENNIVREANGSIVNGDPAFGNSFDDTVDRLVDEPADIDEDADFDGNTLGLEDLSDVVFGGDKSALVSYNNDAETENTEINDGEPNDEFANMDSIKNIIGGMINLF